MYMALPDDFNGSVDDAFVLWQKLRDGPMIAPDLPSEVKRGSLSLNISWSSFYQNSRYSYNTLSEAGIWALRPNGWVRLDKNPDGAHSDGGDTWIK